MSQERFTSAPIHHIGDTLFPHQVDLTRWALNKGRAAIFADTGLGKTRMQLEWARNVATEGRVLIIAPLAVSGQTVREGIEIGVRVKYCREDSPSDQIVITNYEMAEYFDANDFAGVILDESSILKSFTGSTRTMLIEKFASTQYRLACTATPAPNDFTELGNHAEFLGVKTRVEMMAEYFVHDGGSVQNWRIKGHAVNDFWRWVATWGAVVRSPADLGYDDSLYVLPPLNTHEHVIEISAKHGWITGHLFPQQALDLNSQRAVRRNTTAERVRIASEIVSQEDSHALIWCELNNEADAVTSAIPGAVQVKGCDSPDLKTENLLAFANGEIPVLVTKPKIAGFGMNWQHCHRMIFIGASHSYEQTYQAIRRCWRFGQTRPVDVHIIRTSTEYAVVANYLRKEKDAAELGVAMAAHVGDAMRAEIGVSSRHEWNPHNPEQSIEIPAWMTESRNE